MHEFVEPVGRVESREAIIIIIEVVVDKMFDDDLRARMHLGEQPLPPPP